MCRDGEKPSSNILSYFFKRIEGIEFIISIRKSASMFQVELDMMIIEIIAAYAKTKWDFIVLFIYSETLFCFSIWTVNPFRFLHSRHWNFLIPISPSQIILAWFCILIFLFICIFFFFYTYKVSRGISRMFWLWIKYQSCKINFYL